MMEFLQGWIISLVSIVILSVLIDVILPNGSIRKYTRFIIGILVIFVILYPVVRLLNKGFSLDKVIEGNLYKLNIDEFQYKASNMEGLYQKSILDLYKTKLETEIKRQVVVQTGIQNLKVDIVINEDEKSDTYGAIDQIQIQIENQSTSQLPAIKKIDLQQKSTSREVWDDHTTKQSTSIEYRKLQEILSLTYRIQPDHIIIK